MTALITQSNYIPWKGYFDNIASSDVFIIYDDMQYTKRDWRNRNLIKTPNGAKWLSIPVEVKGKYLQKINETKVSDLNWNVNHLKTLSENYSKAPYFNAEKLWLEDLYVNCNSRWLTEINTYFIHAICRKLDVNVEIRDSRDFELKGDKTEKLVNVCKDLGAKRYLTGPAAKAYMDEQIFENSQIEIVYSDYSNYQEYDQIFPPFNHYVTIFDLIFHCGSNSKDYLYAAKEL